MTAMPARRLHTDADRIAFWRTLAIGLSVLVIVQLAAGWLP